MRLITSVKRLLLPSPLVNVALARRSCCHQTVSNTLPLVGPQWCPNHCPSPPGFKLGSCHLFHNQQEALCLPHPASCYTPLLPVVPVAVVAFTTLTPQGILSSRPRPGITMPAILSPCPSIKQLPIQDISGSSVTSN